MTQHELTNLETTYTISSSLDTPFSQMGLAYFRQEITGVIRVFNCVEDDLQEAAVGHVTAFKLLLKLAEAHGKDPVQVLERHSGTRSIARVLCDEHEHRWNKSLTTYLQREMEGMDLLILHTIELLPPYRGRGMGKRVIRDLYNNFISGCGLFAAEVFPLQYSWRGGNLEVEHREELPDDGGAGRRLPGRQRLQTKGDAYRVDMARLRRYFERVGFETIPAVDETIMVIDPLHETQRFRSIQ